METRRSREDLFRLRSFSTVPHEQRVARCGRVVDEASAVSRPVEFGNIMQIGLRRAAEERCAPDADLLFRAGEPACPERDERSVRREAERSHRRVDDVARGSARQVVKLSSADLGDPDIHRSVAIRLESHQFSVAGHCGGLLDAVEVGELQEPGVRQSVAGIVGAGLEPPHAERHGRDGSGTHQRPEPRPASRNRRVCTALWITGFGWRKPPVPTPGIQVGAKRIHRAQLVVDVPVHRHPFALLPTLHRLDVPLHEGGDLFPGVQTIVGRALDGGRRTGMRGVGHAASLAQPQGSGEAGF